MTIQHFPVSWYQFLNSCIRKQWVGAQKPSVCCCWWLISRLTWPWTVGWQGLSCHTTACVTWKTMSTQEALGWWGEEENHCKVRLERAKTLSEHSLHLHRILHGCWWDREQETVYSHCLSTHLIFMLHEQTLGSSDKISPRASVSQAQKKRAREVE